MSWETAKPNLSKLPPHLRDALNAPVPVKRGEAHGRLSIITKRTGLNHPNARVWVNTFEQKGVHLLVLELCDHRGLPQVMLTINPESVGDFRESLNTAFEQLELLSAAKSDHA